MCSRTEHQEEVSTESLTKMVPLRLTATPVGPHNCPPVDPACGGSRENDRKAQKAISLLLSPRMQEEESATEAYAI